MKRSLYFQIFTTLSLVVVLLPWPSISATAQDINHYQIEKVQGAGLFNAHVHCIGQDKLGFIWLGTYECLYRYDGYSFKAFRNFPGDPTTLLNNRITSIYATRNYLWVATWGGLCRVDASSLTLTNFSSPASTAVDAVLQKDDSTLWVGTRSGHMTACKRIAGTRFG